MEELAEEGLRALEAAETESALLEIKGRYFGKKGALTEHLKGVSALPPEARKTLGAAVNAARGRLETDFDRRLAGIRERERIAREGRDRVDVTLPGRAAPIGHRHPVARTMAEITAVFQRLGFSVRCGPDIETDYYNFEALNIPKEHPAREMQDTFYLEWPGGDLVLRTHTSPIQIRTMETMRPPVRVIAPGAVYRCDSDITHSPMFHQVEGLAVDRGTTMADLKGMLTEFCRMMFGPGKPLRFRPSFFPFTEPSAEVDIRCVICGGSGCRVCKNSGWLEILGCGMVDPAVFGFVGYDPEEYTGFAFGMGVERIAMLRHGIADIRLLFENDIRFLSQF
ncbi:MAG: phenylalanine--tRNA ligase subunit alpha [Deltaproteobacteria bacterium GWC2_65_14]|nr:MAG: phenylalanine--tRNA ligase subunit alpha [Deltaproteobacteria bacterium GWC2_65_14]